MYYSKGLILLVVYLHFSLELPENLNILYIIISQNSSYNQHLARNLKQSIETQYHELDLTTPQVLTSPEYFYNDGADWTIFPLIEHILNLNSKEQFQWVFILEDYTKVNKVDILLEELAKYNSSNELWVGHALRDSEATIIHHFAFHKDPTFFTYPNLGSGFAMTVPLLKRLSLPTEGEFNQQSQFHIDASHEFAVLVYDDGKGPMIEDNPKFCCREARNCATYPRKFKSCADSDVSSIHFAIKTCQKFHNTRVPIVKQTWLAFTNQYTFFSDVDDDQIPTVSVQVPNTEQGHCQKAISILKYLKIEFETKTKLEWMALVDDDTILSVSRMADLTSCYADTNTPLILGERYRFGRQGFNYPTGGAGILINKAALRVLALGCTCPHPDSPDDMVIGACADTLGIPLIHVPQLHQARPEDYAAGRLANDDAISFHKHWMIDPVKVYQKWFQEDDEKLVLRHRDDL